MDRQNDQTTGASERRQELEKAHRTYRPGRYRSLLMHWMGRWLRRPKRANVTPLPSVVPGQVGISFSGHATVLLRYANRTIVCDPMLGKWVKGVKRAVMPGLTPADLHDVDIILISHAHQDHLHRPTLAALPKTATVILPPRTAQLVSDLGFARVVELAPDQSIQDHGVDIATARVKHGEDPDVTVSYVIRGDGPSVYFCGDSGYFSGFADIGARYAPDIALLPIGGYAPLSFRDRHMSPLDALYALEDLGSRVMIPIHHGAFTLSYERLDEPVRWLSELVYERELQDFVIPLEPGESRVFVPPSEQHLSPSQSSSESPAAVSGMSFDGRSGASLATDGGPGAGFGPGLVHALPAMRAAVSPSGPIAPIAPGPAAEPAWVRGAAAALPRFGDEPQVRPAFDLALARTEAESPVDSVDEPVIGPAIGPVIGPVIGPAVEAVTEPAVEAVTEPVRAVAIAPASAPVPGMISLADLSAEHSSQVHSDASAHLPELPAHLPELVIEQISSPHSAPIELARKQPEPESWSLSAFDELEALVAARFTDDAYPEEELLGDRTDREQMTAALEHTSAPAHRVLSEALDDTPAETTGEFGPPADTFDLRAALSDHFQRFPNSRLRAHMGLLDGDEDSDDRIPTDLGEQVSEGISRGHRLEPMPAFG